ncbi:MAG: MBL fold metallo-hydrolase, partial [Bacteroidota bacterium]
YGINQVTELDWWQSYKYSGMNFTFVPAKHFSMRGICDRNKTQWGGFVFETSGGPVYFSGDTGFDIHFEQIFKKFGAMRFSMLPIGAYRPRWFMVFFHTSPDDAVLAHKILHSAQTMGIHWGTFMQADDGLLEPLVDLKIALAKHNISDSEFYVLKHGIGHLIPKLK